MLKEFGNIREVIKNAVKEHPDNNAFILKETNGKDVEYKNITYIQNLTKQIDCLGTALVSKGLKRKRIAVIGKNCYEWIVSYLAVVNGTGIVVPLDKRITRKEIETSLIRSESEAIIFEDDYIDMIKNIKSNNQTKVTKFICMNKQDEFENIYKLIDEGEKLLQQGNKEFIESEINNEEMSILLFTSGTTSAAKAVMLSHKNIASNIYSMTKCEDIRSTDTNIAFLPFHRHTFGSTGILMFFIKRSNKCIL